MKAKETANVSVYCKTLNEKYMNFGKHSIVDTSVTMMEMIYLQELMKGLKMPIHLH